MRPDDDHLWAPVHAERSALAEDLSGLSSEQWHHDSLCGKWDVEEVVDHLTAAASVGRWRWPAACMARDTVPTCSTSAV